MNKLFASTLCVAFLATGGIGIADTQADLGLDPNRMFFVYTTPVLDTGDFQVIPGNIYNPIALPCDDVLWFGGQYDVDYLGAGATVSPTVTFTFFAGGVQLVNENGDASRMQPLGPINGGETSENGFVILKSDAHPHEFKPSDLPLNTLVRMHMELSATGVDDPAPSNNGRDIYLRRACTGL